jgi:hypothetical protein
MNKRIDQLTEQTTAALTDLIYIGSPTGAAEAKKITVANFLIGLNLKVGETDIANVTTAGQTFVFTRAYGTSANDYHLVITCRSARGDDEIGYEITAQDENGFTIVPVENARIQWTVILK